MGDIGTKRSAFFEPQLLTHSEKRSSYSNQVRDACVLTRERWCSQPSQLNP